MDKSILAWVDQVDTSLKNLVTVVSKMVEIDTYLEKHLELLKKDIRDLKEAQEFMARTICDQGDVIIDLQTQLDALEEHVMSTK